METVLLDILRALAEKPDVPRLDDREIQAIVRARNEGLAHNEDHFAKKQILPFYLGVKANDPERWRSWDIDAALEKRLLATLQVKPRRTASGVATITVITKPAPCGNACLYCPNDVRMPKSYLHDEPACQRAERNFFDPYLQVVSRARALREMGHNISKLEIIVLGGTWCDYPEGYQRWFAAELFRAANSLADELAGDADTQADARREFYLGCGLVADAEAIAGQTARHQALVDAGELTYNQAAAELYAAGPAWQRASAVQSATMRELEDAQRENETSPHRIVGFVVETRPDTVTPERLALLRSLGCTKVQMGIQSLDPAVLAANNRPTRPERVQRALGLARLFGFKLHTHFMVNLAGATPDSDKAEFAAFVSDPAYLPDEVKLYPCSLVAGTGLVGLYEAGQWRPYTEEELLDVLAADVLATPDYCRISRMIRDISAGDILVGNKKANLRQMVEQRLDKLAGGGADSETGKERTPQAPVVREIRYREISTQAIDLSTLELHDVAYETAVSAEHFLQWTTPEGLIAGFLRLSLPRPEAVAELVGKLETASENDPASPAARAAEALSPEAAMIREVHVYGRAANLGATVDGAQHAGLGRQLVARAEEIAREAGYRRLNVISSVGTREYYRNLGFKEKGLYQQKPL